MAEYRQLVGNEGWQRDVSTNDIVLLDSSGSVVLRFEDATGNTTVAGTLTTTGAATIGGALTASGAATVTGAFTASSTAAITGALTTSSTTTLGGTLATAANDTTTTSGVGAAAAQGTLVAEYGVSRIHNTELTFTNTIAAAGAALAGGALVYTMPAVPTLLLGCYVSGNVYGATETVTPELGVGTLVGSGANAVLSGVGATAENIITGTTIGAITTDPGVAYTLSSAAGGTLSLAASAVIHVNIAATWTATETITYNGTLRLAWMEMA